MLFATQFAAPAFALDRTWIGGNVDWVDGGASTNWNPNDEPDSDDRAIFNTANTVNLGSNNAVNGLALSAGIDLFTNEFDLTVDGLVEVGGAGSNLNINGAAGSINADDVVINASGVLELRGGTLTMDEEAGTALIDINAGGTLQGNGIINFADNPGVATLMLVNDGTLTALSRGLTIFSPPPVGTLTISDDGLNGRLDLDGTGEAGIVNVNRNQTLTTEMQLFDTFNGTLNLFHNSTFDFNPAFTLGTGGSIVVDNGFVAGGIGVSDILADTSYIESAGLIQTGGTINVVDTDGTLQIDAPFTMSGGTFTNSGTVIFNGVTNITAAGGYAPSSLDAQTIVNADVTINHAAADFNWDGNGAADTTINGTGSLAITADQIDTGNDTFGGTLNLNDGGDLSVNNTANVWTLAGTLNKTGASVSTISGEALNVTGAINADGTGTLDLPTTTLSSTANINITSRLTLGSASNLAGATISGTGELEMEGTSTVSANTTIGVATFDWDGVGTGTNHTINSGVTFTINSTTFDSDGDMDDPLNLAGSGSQLIVNGPTEWTATAAINANNAGVGTATIGGTSRLILTGANADLNVNGNTVISAPLTLGSGSLVVIDAGFSLDANGATTYSGVVIDGAGTYIPAATNTVSAFSTIAPDNFRFDAGNWTIEPGAELVVNVVDYDSAATNVFDGTITLHGGIVDVTTSDAEFIMDGTLNMQSEPGFLASWQGQAVDIGNDVGALDANLNVTGVGIAGTTSFVAPVDFNSDADVDVAAGRTLLFSTSSTVNFDTVNGANNAEFTGSGSIAFNGAVNVNEAVTLNMVGGEVDLDGTDPVGEFINIDAPLTINAATLSSFGNVNLGIANMLDVNNSVGTGVLTVNLDDPAAEWTLNGPGVMNLVNDNVEATLLAGSDVNINGTLNVTGDVRTTARLDIGGIVNINTAGQPLRLAGGDNLNDPNTLAGGTIQGVGILSADNGKELRGFGTINTSIEFISASNLFADNGTLTINGAIADVARIGTFDSDGVLNVVNPWDTSVASFVTLEGGTIQGGTMTINNGNGVSGEGLITARLINNVRLRSSDGALVAQTAGNDNDWDGAAGGGVLAAINAGTLELRDVGAAFGFTGTVEASTNSRVFTNGFALDFNPGSTLDLTSSTYESTNSTDIGGTVTVNAGTESRIKVENNSFLSFETGSSSTLDANLRLENNNIIIEQGATFAGAGALVIPDGSHVVGENLANIGVLLDMQGAFRPGNSEGIGRVDLFDYQQANSGELFVEIKGTALNAFDRLVASGDVVLDGYLNIDIDEISPMVPFVPVLGQTFNIITANSVTGAFDYADVSGMPAGLAFHIEYLSNAVQLQVVTKPIFSADFDDDGDVDATDLAIWQGAYNLNQLGDADGDNDSDGRDFMIWQRQHGAAPLTDLTAASSAVPEPGCSILLMLALSAATACRFHK
jgi:fibronectin-binding autotransporter adhesin